MADNDILCLIPELTAIGRPKLQSYCNEWLTRPIAKGIAQINVSPDLLLEIIIDEAQVEYVNDRAFLPLDELLGFIIDQHFEDPEERGQLHVKLRRFKQRFTDRCYGVTVGKVGTLYLKCKNPNCDVFMETSHRATAGTRVNCPPTSLACPVCSHTAMYDGSDFVVRFTE
jgi:hypothetical protein